MVFVYACRALQPPRHCVVVQTRRRRPWRSAWRTCSATSGPPPWRGRRRPLPLPPRLSGPTPVSHLLLISAALVATRQLHCETAVSAMPDLGQKWKFNTDGTHYALVLLLSLSFAIHWKKIEYRTELKGALFCARIPPV